MNIKRENVKIFIPDTINEKSALNRTTHLSIMAHQDDTEIAAYHGIAECFNRDDKWFSSVIITNGAGSPRAGIYEKYSDEDMLKIRCKEQNKAAVMGEYSIQIQLGYPSDIVKDKDNEDPTNDILSILKETQPETVYLHNPADKHDTHVASFAKSIKALRMLPNNEKPKKVYGCEVWRGLDWLQDDEKIALPVSDYKNIASSLISLFDSQVTGGKRYDLATEGRRLANATFYTSHGTDECDALSYAIDLTPLILDKNLSIKDFILNKIDNFKNDVASKIDKYNESNNNK